MNKTTMMLTLLLTSLAWSGLGVWPAAAAEATWPMVDAVPSQPAAAELRRLIETAGTLGEPLDEQLADGLERLRASGDETEAAEQLQAILDPLCGLAVVLGASAPPKLISGERPIELIEQGWAMVLVWGSDPPASGQLHGAVLARP